MREDHELNVFEPQQTTITMPPKRGRTGPTAVSGTPALKRAKTEKIVLVPEEQQIFKGCVFCKLKNKIKLYLQSTNGKFT